MCRVLVSPISSASIMLHFFSKHHEMFFFFLFESTRIFFVKKIIFFSLFLVSTWCGSQVYSVAFFANAFPFAFKNEAGNVTGLDVDLMRAIAKNQKLNIELFTHDWSELFEKLDNGSRDIVMGGITITPERQRLYGTSEPYLLPNMRWVICRPQRLRQRLPISIV
ncbi:bacterial solute binding family protein [Dichelobacter nodosus VCS1703A]|uniref:Bacterial solute binding family protein n=1 Tax=Dichelobacter nodosus (strain VCS1703A) TaxID=246195 RepID=A5EWP1_DICNV|nr:bacterial solute binding family protein [Dichelobacter nodosus VCS1703A]AXM45053.1 hypothetical protein DYQ38_00595 [Dichelobacter nodosus]